MFDQIIQRLVRIAKFDMTVYEEIEHDESANTEALIVVVVSSILAALGVVLGGAGIGVALTRLIAGILIYWLLWSYVTMFIGTRFFQAQVSFWEMARMVGYASAPLALEILNVIPCLPWIIGPAAWVLALVVAFLAVREALDLPLEKTILTIIVGWLIVLVVQILTPL